jgi:hypothetical protein
MNPSRPGKERAWISSTLIHGPLTSIAGMGFRRIGFVVSEVSNSSRLNRHVADQLFDIRATIRNLERQEEALRDHLIRNPHDRCGDEHMATVQVWDRKRIDVEGLLAEVGPEIAARHTTTRPIRYVKLAPVHTTRRKAKAA